MVLILALNICNQVNTDSWNKKENTQMLMKDNEQTTVHSFFIRTILKKQWDLLENKKNIRTSNVEINTKNFLSKFGKQKCTVINKEILKDNLSTRWGVI